MGKCDVIIGVILTSILIAATPDKTAEVVVRAVLISCEPDGEQSVPFDNEAIRFEREELFKHSVLRDCRKKIALTVKIASDPDNSGDEYIPIEHVFQGPNKRVRLLNPYVLRLRREPPLQAYKLRKIDTVTGTLYKETTTRVKRNSATSEEFTHKKQHKVLAMNSTIKFLQTSENCELPFSPSHSKNNACVSRLKRHENNIAKSAKQKLNPIDNKYHFGSDLEVNEPINRAYDEFLRDVIDDSMSERSININDINRSGNEARIENWKPINEAVLLKTKKPKAPQPYEVYTKIDWPSGDEPNAGNQIKNVKQKSINMVDDIGKEYVIYEIGNADLWYTIQVQLFEKLSTDEGKTVWNDLTKGTPARVSSLHPEWTSQDMSIRYRSSEWIPRTEFTLPVTRMCLLAPIMDEKATPGKHSADQYIVIPRGDIVGLPDVTSKRDEGLPQGVSNANPNEQPLRRVLIRTSRALFGGVGEKVTIASKGDDQYLTLVHRQPYHAQLDLEARADSNQLVHVGTFGRIMTVVADNSRRTRTVLTVQATNTGLAAARFKVVTRDCNPELPKLMIDKSSEVADTILLPPKHTQSIRLELPTEIPVDVAHCSVALINGNDQSVAVRDVTIKKDDRCFCVWHCECVCLGEDPKLLCREMPEARQIAAGLSLRERTRNIRSACYQDVVSVNLFITVFGVLTTLLLFGLLKACLGLVFRCIGFWGLHYILQMPRRLDHYYEPSLRQRKVVYDDKGWPIHPDTKQRSVRLISKSMEFVLNTIFFITAPCVITYETIRRLLNRYKKTDANGANLNSNNTKNCFSSTDMQGNRERFRRRRPKLQRWMSPEAETLSSNLWQKGLPVRASMIKECMRPLLREEYFRGDLRGTGGCRGGDGGAETHIVQESCCDSEVDDTEYVLMQMQKSRESLARSQRKLNGTVAATTGKQ